MTDYKDTIINEFNLLVRKAKSDRTNGWQWKMKNYQRVISILFNSDKIDSTETALIILRNSGMKLPKEVGPNWKSKILINIDKIISEGSLGLVSDPKLEIMEQLVKIPEVGPSKAKQIYDAGIHTLEDLIKNPDLLNRKQLIGLRHMNDLKQKIPRDEMTIWGNSLKDLVTRVVDESSIIRHMNLVGSYRRGKLESGDIDFHIVLETPRKGLMNKIYNKLVEEGYIVKDDWFSKGEKKLMAVSKLGIDNVARHLDIFIYSLDEFPFALLYSTGSGEFNVNMRNYARSKGYSLSDKGILEGNNKGDHVKKEKYLELIGKEKVDCEEDIFKFFGLEYMEPKDRLPEFKFI